MNQADICAHCGRPRAHHCPDCLTPLCDCIDFVEPEGLKEASLERDPPLTERERKQELGIKEPR